MRTFLLFLLVGCSSSSGSDPQQQPDPGTQSNDAGVDAVTDGGADATPQGEPALSFEGRFDTSDPAGPRFAWSGSSVSARFEGPSVTLRLRDTSAKNDASRRNHFTVIVDGKISEIVAAPSTESYPLASGLSAGPHEVQVVRNTEAFMGESQILGFDFGGGKLLAPDAPPAHRLEIIGDSISCGYGNEGPNETCPFSADTENAYLAYGPLTGRAVNAGVTVVAWSGKGVYRNNDGSTGDTMRVLYKRILPDRADSAWGFGSKPDAVLINLHTNDFAQGNPPEAPFVAAYKELVDFVRSKYAGVHVYVAVGPMMSDFYPQGAQALTTARKYITSVAQSYADGRVHLIEFPVQDQQKNGLGCDWHPSLKTHEQMATQLAGVLKKDLGW